MHALSINVAKLLALNIRRKKNPINSGRSLNYKDLNLPTQTQARGHQ